MARKLLEKAGLVQIPPPAKPPLTTANPDSARPKTAPGSMIHFMSAQSSAVKEAETLRERLADFDGALPVRRLDPAAIGVSSWANRHATSFAEPSFEAFKAEIASAGGNVQPIKVRPVEPSAHRGVGRSNPPGRASNVSYEIVYGHRRHRACLELGLPVLALVEDVPEQRLFVEMERENRARKDLSAWEQGCMYARALDAGLFPSNRQLAAAIGRDLGDVGKAIALARLPQAVVGAFATPLDLQYRWAKPLSDAQQRDPDGLIRRATRLRARHGIQLPPKRVFEMLTAHEEGVGPSNPQAAEDVEQEDSSPVVLVQDIRRRTVIRIDATLTPDQKRGLLDVVRKFLSA